VEGGVAQTEGAGLKKILGNLPELWNEQQYSDEYDLTGFIKSLAATD
jgi:hypothetical protein